MGMAVQIEHSDIVNVLFTLAAVNSKTEHLYFTNADHANN